MALTKKIKILLIVAISVIVVSATVIPVVIILHKNNDNPPEEDDGILTIEEITSVDFGDNFYLNWYTALDHENNRLFVSSENGLRLYNVSNPEKPILLDTLGANVAYMHYYNGYLFGRSVDYHGSANYLMVFTIEEGKIVHKNSVYSVYIGGMLDIYVLPERNLLITTGDRLSVWDITDPINPEFKSGLTYEMLTPEQGTYRSDGIAFHPTEPVMLISLQIQDFLLYDYSNASELERIWINHDTGAVNMATDGRNFRVVSRGQYPMFIHQGYKLYTINWTDAQKPVVLDDYFLLYEEYGAKISNINTGKVLVYGAAEGVLNVTDYTNLSYITDVKTPPNTHIGVNPHPILSYPFIYTIVPSDGMKLKIFKVS